MSDITWEIKDTMIYLDGNQRSFKCDCGCNVFRKAENLNKYKCNSCEAIYTGN